jgi:hypothetical protein
MYFKPIQHLFFERHIVTVHVTVRFVSVADKHMFNVFHGISVCEWPECSCGMRTFHKICFLQILKHKYKEITCTAEFSSVF